VGLVPMWLSSRHCTAELEQSRRDLRLDQVLNLLGAAALDARRGEYEQARQETSDFFTALLAETQDGGEHILTAQQLSDVRPLLAQRDDLITLLARSDPASADRLATLYVGYRKATGVPSPQKPSH
jgi:hypothetical protein